MVMRFGTWNVRTLLQAGNKGRPRKRWIEDIDKDIQIMGIRGWRKLCKERVEENH